LLGLLLGLALLLFGGSVQRVDGVLEFAWRRRGPAPAFPIAAITFGHVVLGLNRPTLAHWRAHEYVHVRQYERWGLLFFLAYPLSGVWQWCRGRSAYWHNPFEVQARQLSQPISLTRSTGGKVSHHQPESEPHGQAQLPVRETSARAAKKAEERREGAAQDASAPGH
jgi:hypothetical protein